MNLAGVLIFVHYPEDTLIAMFVLSGSMALNSIWMIVYYMRHYGKIKFDFDTKFWKNLIKAAVPIGMIFFIVTIYNNLNLSMLGFMHDDKSYAGYYFAAYKILILAIIPTNIIQNAFSLICPEQLLSKSATG
jgi:O-antigen/teichoic acid export membrane protein